jgi:hypothetical protein
VKRGPDIASTLTKADAPMLGEEELPQIEVEAAPLPTDAQLKKVRDLANLQVTLEGRIAKGLALLKELGEAHAAVSQRDLPLAMKELGMKSFELTGGVRIGIETFVSASIPKDKAAQAFKIVEGLGEGSIIKHAITILFGRDEDAWAAKFMRDMAQRKKPLNHSRKDWIEPMTLKKFVKEKIAALRAKNDDPFLTLPKDVFGIYEGEASVVEMPGKAP